MNRKILEKLFECRTLDTRKYRYHLIETPYNIIVVRVPLGDDGLVVTYQYAKE